jgi:hypothetical protein
VNDEGPVSNFSTTDRGFCLQFCIKPANSIVSFAHCPPANPPLCFGEGKFGIYLDFVSTFAKASADKVGICIFQFIWISNKQNLVLSIKESD